MSESSISVTRDVAAPAEKIWKALTTPERVAQWWGPSGFTSTIRTMDVKPGGVWELVLHGPDGTDYPNRMTFDEVVPNERLTYRHDESTEFGLAAWQAEITIEDLGGTSRVTLTNRFANDEEKAKQVEQMGAVQGSKQTLERLAALVEA